MMANVFDVAEYILQGRNVSAMKLQKLVYYSQAWHASWTDSPLFLNRIEAWKDGPVSPELYARHARQFYVSSVGGNPAALSEAEHESINKVLRFYGDKSPQWLSDLTHMEDPWRDARRGVPDGASSNNVIEVSSMVEYYSAL